MADPFPRDAVFRTVSETLLAEMERALSQAQAATADMEQRTRAAAEATPAPSSPPEFAPVAHNLAKLAACVQAVNAQAEPMDQLLSVEEAALTAWGREARRVGATLAEWVGRPVR